MERLIRRILKEIREKNPLEQFKEYLEYKINFEGYDLDKNPSNKFSQVYNVFISEYGWAIKQGLSRKEALIEWLQGPPSVIHIPFYYDDIRNFLYVSGFLDVKEKMEDGKFKIEDDELSDFYYNLVADTILENK